MVEEAALKRVRALQSKQEALARLFKETQDRSTQLYNRQDWQQHKKKYERKGPLIDDKVFAKVKAACWVPTGYLRERLEYDHGINRPARDDTWNQLKKDFQMLERSVPKSSFPNILPTCDCTKQKN